MTTSDSPKRSRLDIHRGILPDRLTSTTWTSHDQITQIVINKALPVAQQERALRYELSSIAAEYFPAHVMDHKKQYPFRLNAAVIAIVIIALLAALFGHELLDPSRMIGGVPSGLLHA